MASSQFADLLVVNAKVWTGDSARPEASAFAVKSGRFIFVGDDAGAKKLRDPHTQVIDAGRDRIIPGLIDSHLHLIGGGLQLSRIELRDVAGPADFVKAVDEKIRFLRPGEWLLGGRWSTESWTAPANPTKDWIDPVTPNNPVLLDRMDGHGALANSMALKIAGIDAKGPPDPPGGKIERDSGTGEPTGILKESAINLVSRHVPPPTFEQQQRALWDAMLSASHCGVTTVHTMSAWNELAVIDAFRAKDRPRIRVRFYISEDDWSEYIDRAKQHKDDDWVRICGFKQFMDGSLGSRTAYMAAPFADNTPDKAEWRGLLGEAMTTEGSLQRMCNLVDAAGFTPAIHAIGDQANHLVLDMYEQTQKTNGPRPGRRMRIEHAQHLLPGDIARFASLGVVASMQPLHKADDGRYAEKAIGPQRCKTSYAFRSLLDAGTHVAFGSDWPVVSVNPFLGMHAAVTGTTLDGKTFVPEQNITIEEALKAYTVGGAFAAGDEDRLGQIRAGFLADFVILNEDVLAVAPEDVPKVSAKKTFINGQHGTRDLSY
ncbi:MAG TPA: amidohydrolase [Phycisphaerae bacterium]|nr:amidohydrolase [Phycisphaerae bacterium]